MKNNIMDIIRCDKQSYLIWKWRPSDSTANKKGRENAIRYGSSLRVNEGEAAVFIHNQNGEMISEYIYGPADRILETDNLPVISDLFEKMFGKGTPFQAEIYFINLTRSVQQKFGVPFFNVYDYKVPNAPVPMAVRGTISFKIADYKEFVNLHGLASFNEEELLNKIRNYVSLSIKETVGNYSCDNEIPVNQLDRNLSDISQKAYKTLCEQIRTNLAITLTELSITSVEIDTCSEEYAKYSSSAD